MGENIYCVGKYRDKDKMATLVCDNYLILPVMCRFGIALGFAEKSIREVCEDNGVDTTTFLAVVNLTLRHRDKSYFPTLDEVQIREVIDYLRKSHDFYLSYRLPKIRAKLHNVLKGDKISSLIIEYFDDYVNHIKEHLNYEEQEVFPYIEHLLCGESTNGYSIDKFSAHHDNIDQPLKELKDVITKYYNGGDSDDVTRIILDLLLCAEDLARHNIVEDRLLVPLILKLEGANAS